MLFKISVNAMWQFPFFMLMLMMHSVSINSVPGTKKALVLQMERLWSFLGRFARMSKEMSSANRVDLLSDALSHYCKLKLEKLGKEAVLAIVGPY